MEIVRSGFRNHVDGCAFAAPVCGGEPLSAYVEFLHGVQGKLHDGAADCVVFVVDPIDSDVYIPSVRSVDPEYRNAVLGGIVGIHRLRARRQKRKIREVAAIQGQALHLGGRDRTADIRSAGIYQWSCVLNVDHAALLARLQGRGDRTRSGYLQSDLVIDSSLKPWRLYRKRVGSSGQAIETIVAAFSRLLFANRAGGGISQF